MSKQFFFLAQAFVQRTMFNEAFLNAEPQPVIVDAPVQCPPPVSSLIGERHMTFFHHQFTSPPLVVFDPSPQIDTALTARFLSVVRERIGDFNTLPTLHSAFRHRLQISCMYHNKVVDSG